MHIEVIKTHRIQCGESINLILDHYIPALEEQSILAISSKIISISQGRVVAKSEHDKETLVRQEADAVIDSAYQNYGVYLTIKNNRLIPSAGIDESNGDGVYILYPRNIQEIAFSLWTDLRKKHAIEHLGIIITDSHVTPLRRGVIGIALGWCGFEALYSYIGKLDIYGQPLRVTQINLLDALATSAVLMMGEGCEQTPLALIRNAPKLNFLLRPPTSQEEQDISIPMHEDLYAPLFMELWRTNKELE